MAYVQKNPLQSSWLGGDLILAGANLYGKEFYVDGTNGSDTNSGKSWKKPIKTIAQAITLADAERAVTGRANYRNRIFIGGGDYSEAIVALPNSCDIIGCGSTSGYPSTMTGVWTIAARVTGCRMYNLKWNVNSATTVLSFADNDWYNELHNCVFYAGGSSGYAIDFADGGSYTVIDSCMFIGNVLYTTAIHAASNFHNCRITNNIICASAKGIHLAVNTGVEQTIIAHNYIMSSSGSSGAQLEVGIHKETEASCLICNNWISAVDGIYHVDNNYVIDNHIVAATAGEIETASS